MQIKMLRSLKYLMLVSLLSLFSCHSHSLSFHHTRHKRNLDTGPEELGNYVFPEPKIENVYEAWKPIDYGHPLVDVTIHYAPPELERVHIGSGPVPDRPTRNNKHNIVFEAAREVPGRHTDPTLQAFVYNSPRLDKGLNLNQRDAIVAIPSQRRNSIYPLRPYDQSSDTRHPQTAQHSSRRGGSVLTRRKRPKKLKSGIYYVDDPHETYRDETEKAQNRVSDADYEYYYEDPSDFQIPSSQPDIGVRYVPVSQITTPPTVKSTEIPYGQIVNKDFYDGLSSPAGSSRLQSSPTKNARKVADHELDDGTRAFPLGNPYYRYPHNYHQLQADSRSDNDHLRPSGGYVDNEAGPHVASHHQTGQYSWAPSQQSFSSYDREMTFDKDQVIYSVKDSGELYLPDTDNTPVLGEAAEEYNLVYAVDDRSSFNVTAESGAEAGAGSIGQLGAVITHGQQEPSHPSEDQLNSEFVYLLCMREVPKYLQAHLCKSPAKNSKSSQNIQRISRFSDKTPPNLTAESSQVSVILPPKTQFQFVQDNQYVASTEAVFQERTLSDVPEDENLVDDPLSVPFPFVAAASSGPAPVIYSVAQPKVRVYKPEKTTTTASTTTTTTTTASTTTITTTTVKPFHYQLPTKQPVPEIQTQPRLKLKKRPILYTKRRPGGKTSVSKPFEYLSRLSQFFSDRVLTGRTSNRQKHPSEYPRPLTSRIQLQS